MYTFGGGGVERVLWGEKSWTIQNLEFQTASMTSEGMDTRPPVLGNKRPRKHIFLAWQAETRNP